MTKKLPVSLLNLEFSENGELFLNGVKQTPSIRKLGEVAEVLADQDFLRSANLDQPLYFMYRDIARAADRQLFLEMQLRYDVTIMLPKMLGREFNKTLGHYHPKVAGELTYLEVYEVLSGRAHYLLQKVSNNEVIDVVLVEAGGGDKIVVPSGYGHITINPSSEECLVMSNLVYRGFESVYEPMKRLRGGAFYELSDGELKPNANYRILKEIRKSSAEEFCLRFDSRDLYSLFIERPESFVFLRDPAKY